MNRLVLLAICLPAVFGAALDDEWNEWVQTYQKSYQNQDELAARRSIWQENMEMITKHNFRASLGQHSYTLGMNEFGDLTLKEFVAVFNGFNSSAPKIPGSTFLEPANVELPTHVDWRTKGYVTGIKNQEACGSCWAFSATGSLEGQHFKKDAKLISLSEQNLIDCSKPEGNHGCEGGLMDNAFSYIKINHGIDSEKSYPYEAKDDKCRYQKRFDSATVTGFTDIPSGNEKALTKAIATVGPISVAINARLTSFRFYKHGVYNAPNCAGGRMDLDHGVLAVGYGVMDGVDYYIVKNSWGTTWGMKGYILMSRNKNNQCGIATAASYPLV